MYVQCFSLSFQVWEKNSKNSSSIPTLQTENVLAATPQAKADLLSTTFEMNSVTPLSEDDVLPVPPQECPVALLCSEDDIIRLFSNLHTTKSTSPDSISGLMLKNTALAVPPLVTHLFNMSISNSTVPDSWKTSLIVPIHKQGHKSNPRNYRSISLLSIIIKVLEWHIYEKLCNFLSISDQQWGFLTGSSTTGAILSAVND